jgi:hypothetical protein
MSTWFDKTIECATCGVPFTARLASGVHAPRAPEIREQIFARTFHRVACPHCAATFTAKRPLVYTDTERRLFVRVEAPIERPRWPEHEVATERLFDRAMTGSPLALELREGFLVRVVFGLEELREKLVIWHANLDDAVVECLKVQLLAERPLLAKTPLVVDEIRDGALEVVAAKEHFTIPRELVAQFHDDERLRARFPELFGGRYVSIDRLLGYRYRWVDPP